MTGAHYSRRSLAIDREPWKRRRMGQGSDTALAAKRITGLFPRRDKGLDGRIRGTRKLATIFRCGNGAVKEQ